MNLDRHALVPALLLACSAAVGSFGLAACGDGADAPTEVEADDDGKADGVAYPVGTYLLETPSGADTQDLEVLVLGTDRSFAVTRGGGVCGPACARTVRGHFKLTRSTTTATRFLRLTEDDGELFGRWAWVLEHDALTLTDPESELTQVLAHSDTGWCAHASDCEVQALFPEDCDGAWRCAASACAYACEP